MSTSGLWLLSITYTHIQGITCHMGSHSVTCHPTQVNVPRLNLSQPGLYLIYLGLYPGRMEGWVDLGSLIAARPGIEPTTAWSQVRRPNRHATESVELDVDQGVFIELRGKSTQEVQIKHWSNESLSCACFNKKAVLSQGNRAMRYVRSCFDQHVMKL